MNELNYRAFWKKYIDRPLYRVLPSTDLQNVLRNGINPKKDPFEKMKPKFKDLFNIVLKLERKGFVMVFQLKKNGKKSVGSYWCKVAKSDLAKPVVDFTPSLKSVRYYLGLRGGAMVSCIRRFTKRIIKENYPLTEKEWKLVYELDKWAESKTVPNKTILISGSSRVFETALFQLTKMSKTKVKRKFIDRYYETPFGSYAHFMRVVRVHGIRKYIDRLKTGEYHLRVRERIPASEIKEMK